MSTEYSLCPETGIRRDPMQGHGAGVGGCEGGSDGNEPSHGRPSRWSASIWRRREASPVSGKRNTPRRSRR